jgi:hypothetical protein
VSNALNVAVSISRKTEKMAAHDRISAVYYPDSSPKDHMAFGTLCLYFDEVHFIGPSDVASDVESYTSWLRNMAPEPRLAAFGDTSEPELQRAIERMRRLLVFALECKPLLGKVVFYHPHLEATEMSDFARQLLKEGKISLDQMFEVVNWETARLRKVREFIKQNPGTDEIQGLILSSARHLAEVDNYIPVSDDPALPAPVIRPIESSVEDQSLALAGECFRLLVPAVKDANAEDLLEVRDKLQTELLAFRMMLNRLCKGLRPLLSDRPDRAKVAREAAYVVETTVKPALADLQRRIELEKGTLLRRTFGAAIGWIPVLAEAYVAPSPGLIAKALERASGDARSLLEAAHGITAAGDPGLSFILEARRLLSKQS